MKLLIFDTETTGKIEKPYCKLPINDETVKEFPFPYVVQLSFILFDTQTYKYSDFDYVIKVPDMVDISEEVVDIHGITKGRSRATGHSFKDIYEIFKVCLQQCDMIIAHNIVFDLKMLRIECIRHKIPFIVTKPTYCTQMSTIRLCNLPFVYKKGNGKWPSLKELHYFLFHEEATGLHNSMIDVIVCLRCYMKVMHKVDICKTIKKLKCT